ncbi:hypothetical protein AVEN_11317-1 [Araneus ventricosus]|uniref:Uncharacterized protein n=1 Tax=Araneus ventricosus TaxID=182803 RepID=A0A4Y2E1J3_ARAVE|nr:hypothetical protein AVEN_11317-1 [Araneus ventricosus]
MYSALILQVVVDLVDTPEDPEAISESMRPVHPKESKVSRRLGTTSCLKAPGMQDDQVWLFIAIHFRQIQKYPELSEKKFQTFVPHKVSSKSCLVYCCRRSVDEPPVKSVIPVMHEVRMMTSFIPDF